MTARSKTEKHREVLRPIPKSRLKVDKPKDFDLESFCESKVAADFVSKKAAKKLHARNPARNK